MSHPDPATTPVQSLRGLLLLILLPWALLPAWVIGGPRGLLLTMLCYAVTVLLKHPKWRVWVVLCLGAWAALIYLHYHATPTA